MEPKDMVIIIVIKTIITYRFYYFVGLFTSDIYF